MIDGLLRALVITPEPTEAERKAIAAALARVLEARTAGQGLAAQAASRWKAAGRRESVRGLAGGPDIGWGRGRSRWDVRV